MTVKPSILVFTHDHLDQNDSETVSHFLENDTHARAALYVWNRETSKHHFLAPICTEKHLAGDAFSVIPLQPVQ